MFEGVDKPETEGPVLPPQALIKLREIIIKNYRQKERLDEIINTATWSLTRMLENSVK